MKNFELTAFNHPFIRVVLVDDHRSVAEGYERLINDSENVRVIGKAYNIDGCRELLEVVQPDVVMLDVGFANDKDNGIDLCSEIKEKYPHIKVLMLTSYNELYTITRALDAGADGYVLKSSTIEEILEGIHTVMSGGRFLCDEVNATIRKSERRQIELTRREMELLKLIAEGLSLSQQADKMCLGQNTIRTYRQQLNIKLDAHSTVQLLQNAKALNLV